jgi:hypothetical protein
MIPVSSERAARNNQQGGADIYSTEKHSKTIVLQQRLYFADRKYENELANWLQNKSYSSDSTGIIILQIFLPSCTVQTYIYFTTDSNALHFIALRSENNAALSKHIVNVAHNEIIRKNWYIKHGTIFFCADSEFITVPIR